MQKNIYIQEKDLLNLRQPIKQYRVNLTLPSVINMNLLSLWCTETFEIENDHLEESEIVQISKKALILIKMMLQSSQVPVYYEGEIINIQEIKDEKNKFIIDVAVGYIHFIPSQHYFGIVNFAFKSIFWMMENQFIQQNKEIFYKSCLEEIINPIVATMPAGKSTMHVLEMTYSKNIPFIHLGAGVYQLGWGAKARKIDRSTIDADSAMGAQLAQNKVVTANLLGMAGLPAPIHGVADTKENALKIAHELMYPVVVKPIDLDRGEGVSINIQNDEQLLGAFEEAMKLSRVKQIIVERQVEGICCRLFIAEGKLVYAVKRLPISVKADGVKTISELIADANRLEDIKAPWLKTSLFPRDALTEDSITKYGYNFNSIPQNETWIPLRDIESGRWGGRDEDVTQIVHAENLYIALKASRLFGLSVVGIDLITSDISRPWYENGAIINEVNFAPLFGGGEISRHYMSNFFDTFIDKDGRIPLEIFIGADEKTMQKAIARQKILIKNGLKCYVTTHLKTMDEDSRQLKYPSNSISDRTTALLLNSDVEALVLVLQNEEFMNTFIPFDKVSNLYVSSTEVKDFNDETGLTKQQIAKLKQLFIHHFVVS